MSDDNDSTPIKSSAEVLEKLGDILELAEKNLMNIIDSCPTEYRKRVEEIIFTSLRARIYEFFQEKEDKKVLEKIAKSGLIILPH